VCVPTRLILLAATLSSAPVLADRGALTVEAGAGAAGTLLPAPTPPAFTITTGATTGLTAGAGWLGARYALSNQLEVSVSAFYEPRVSVFHNGVVLQPAEPPATAFPGTLSHRLVEYGGLAGARWVTGSVWRFIVTCELGWARRLYSGFTHYDDRATSGAVDYRLSLADTTADAVLLSLGGGLEWAFADKLSLSLIPRIQLAAGSAVVPSVVIPLVVSYSWYL